MLYHHCASTNIVCVIWHVDFIDACAAAADDDDDDYYDDDDDDDDDGDRYSWNVYRQPGDSSPRWSQSELLGW